MQKDVAANPPPPWQGAVPARVTRGDILGPDGVLGAFRTQLDAGALAPGWGFPQPLRGLGTLPRPPPRVPTGLPPLGSGVGRGEGAGSQLNGSQS